MREFYKKLVSKVGIIFLMALVFGVLRFGSTYAATIGQQLTAPESGWQRIDDYNNNISYIGSWSAYSTTQPTWNGTDHETRIPAQKIKFNFTGNRIRILAYANSDRATDSSINIDGNISNFSSNSTSLIPQYLVFEKTGLSNGEHSVEITSGSTNTYKLVFDAIDIDSSGQIKPYNSIVVTGISLNKTIDNINVGQTDTLSTIITPDNATNTLVDWTSSNNNIVTVDSTGKITAVAPGVANIVATIQDGSNISASCEVTVQVPTVVAISISLNKTTDSLIVGNNDQLTATITPDNATNKAVTWASSDTTIATVDSTGKITALKAGTTNITVITTDVSNLSASCTVTVIAPITSKAILTITMTNGLEKEYDLSMTEVNAFINWYNVRASGTGNAYYTFSKNSSLATFLKRTEYILYDKILEFNVDEYKIQ